MSSILTGHSSTPGIGLEVIVKFTTEDSGLMVLHGLKRISFVCDFPLFTFSPRDQVISERNCEIKCWYFFILVRN